MANLARKYILFCNLLFPHLFQNLLGLEKNNTEKIFPTNLKSESYRVLENVKKNKAIQDALDRCVRVLKQFTCSRGSENFQILKSLLDQYPELICLKDSSNRTLLFYSVYFGHMDVVAHLLHLGYSLNTLDYFLNTQDCEGNTALLLAIKKECLEAVVLLLTYDADPRICNNNKSDAYDSSLALLDPTIAVIILKKCPLI